MSKLKRECICTEHILLAMLTTKGTCLGAALPTFGVSYFRTYDLALKLLGEEPTFPVPVPFSKLVAPIFDKSEKIASESNCEITNTKHLLIALIDDCNRPRKRLAHRSHFSVLRTGFT